MSVAGASLTPKQESKRRSDKAGGHAVQMQAQPDEQSGGAPAGVPLFLQMKCAGCEEEDSAAVTSPVQLWDCTEYGQPTCELPVQTKCSECEAEEQVQHDGEPPPAKNARTIQREARRGLSNASQPLPHADRIQEAFGRHDVSHVRTGIGGTAGQANRRMGALAFASGDQIGFRDTPDLHLAAHEAAHVIQQREGLSLPGNVGRSGDRWERHADLVADTVVAGRSAEALLDTVAKPRGSSAQGGNANAGPSVQHKFTSTAERLFEGEPAEIATPATEKGGAGTAPGKSAGGDERAPEPENESALEAADEGPAEAPPPGTGPEGAAGSGAAASGGAGADGAASATPGGEINAGCYDAKKEPPPENAKEPQSDKPSTESKKETSVTFEAWTEELDTCPAEAVTAEGAQQVPGGLGEGAGAQSPGGAESGGPPAANAEPSAASEGGDASESGEVHAMTRAADVEASQSESISGSMDGAILGVEGERDGAVAEQETSSSLLDETVSRSQRIAQGVTFGSGSDDATRQVAVEQVRDFMTRTAGQIAAAAAFAQDEVPLRLAGMAETVKADIQAAMDIEKAAISDRVDQASQLSTIGAARARNHVNAEYEASVARIDAETTTAIATLHMQHAVSIAQVDQKENDGLTDVNSRFATGRADHEKKGPEYAKLAIGRGQAHVAKYEDCKRGYKDDGFWDGCHTVRRAKAQQDAACKTAAGYQDAFLRLANKKGYDLKELRKKYRCAVIAGARQVNQTLDATREQLVSGLESGRVQAITGLGSAREQNLAAIDGALTATLKTLAAQKTSQCQAVDDTGYLNQVTVERLAHAGAASLTRGVTAAMDSLEKALAGLGEQFSRSGVPDPEALARTLATTEASLGGGMGLLLATMQEGANAAETSIAECGGAALDALGEITTANTDLSSQVESGYAGQMSDLMATASGIFGKLTGNHVQKTQQTAGEGVASMKQAVAGFDKALGMIGGQVDGAIAQSLQQLDKELATKFAQLDGQIASEAWKAAKKEQPAWKSVLAIVLIILVIIAAAVISIVTLGAGASLFAVILVGALVGAVSGGLIQLINNWASGAEWHEGLVQSMVMGAVGGALGGGLGFAAGAVTRAAAPLVQRGVSLLADLASEGLSQTFGYAAFGQQFSWQGFLMSGAMSSVSFVPHGGGGAHGAAPHGAAPHAGAPAAAGGGRRAAAQIAGGAAVGLGLEGATSLITGEKFDPNRAFSAAASGAVGARAGRRGHPAGGGTEPPARPAHAGEIESPAAVRPHAGEEPAPTRRAEEGSPPRPHEETPETKGRPKPEEDSTTTSESKVREVADMDADSDLAIPGASRKIEVGDSRHTVAAKRTSDGQIVLTSCSNCMILRDRLKALAESLPAGPAKIEAEKLAVEAATLQQRINSKAGVADIAGETRALAGRIGDAAKIHPELLWSLKNLLEGTTARPWAPVAPEPGGRIDAASAAEFASRTGGTNPSGWFEAQNAFSKTARTDPQRNQDTAWQWYEKAKTTGAQPVLGEFKAAQNAVAERTEQRAGAAANAAPPELYRLNAPPKDWQLQVNDAWIAAHVERGSTFDVVSNPTTLGNLETRLNRGRGDRVQSVFGRELQVLERHGYRYVQDEGPRDPNSTSRIRRGRMVPPSEVERLPQQGYEWIEFKTPHNQFEGITGRWVRRAQQTAID